MFNLNEFKGIGWIVTEPKTEFTKNGIIVCSFTIALPRKRNLEKNNEHDDFIRIVLWDKLAEYYSTRLEKGHEVFVSGRLQSESYHNSKDGRKIYSVKIIANILRILNEPKEKIEEVDPYEE